MINNIFIGTSGYDYPEWKNIFYPANLKRTEFLSFYSTKFNALELNYSFYSMPTQKQMISFIQKSDEHLLFCIKANKTLTHEIDYQNFDNAKTFLSAIDPLLQKNLLTSVLFQFPQSFHYIPENRIYLSKLLNEFSSIPKVVEFRHKAWYVNSVFEGLSKHNSSLAYCDMPSISNLPQSIQNANLHSFDNKLFYLRLHGRNSDNWYNQNPSSPSSRYEYDYSDYELEELKPVILNATSNSKLCQIFFNNHPNGSAAKNAINFKRILST